ncbi:SidA/IucD/PvdA family monooxygenase [Lipingzhangella sp. LS1_29]|uniref:L-lysine N6-monooxygenase MbtG n=1 Tax=Lipingzhangella rawalii TaxID=2055835 RepID=A0ABU2H7K6_9ACTN|nr:SidA/IucD/PvdA family monooxygenase [Lipingzhangella rawalii]MDS1271281.1 SidA/IucD/PvdA family monooxygenase [Lipingzhangella rawalii]
MPEAPTAHGADAHDVLAVGLGPFNLGLACLSEPLSDLDVVVLEQEPEFTWHGGMLLDEATLQTPFLADLVTLADPTSPYSFLNYLKASNRLYPFYIRESFFPLRSEFNDYCRWATERLGNQHLHFDTRVTAIRHDPGTDHYLVQAIRPTTGEELTYRARRLVLGTGTPPHLPDAFSEIDTAGLHSSHYLSRREQLVASSSITVVGSGQSAAEIYYDLLRDIDRHDYALTWVTRSPRFFPLEYTKLTLELTSPDYTDHFHALPAATREALLRQQNPLYKGIDSSLINEIYELLYTKSHRGHCPTRLLPATAVTGAHRDPDSGTFELQLHHTEQDVRHTHTTAEVVLATGYSYRPPDFLSPIAERLRWDGEGRLVAARNYSVDQRGSEVFVQNAELHTHGFVTPDLGMAAYRNSSILRELTGREPYPVESTTTFQTFTAPMELP